MLQPDLLIAVAGTPAQKFWRTCPPLGNLLFTQPWLNLMINEPVQACREQQLLPPPGHCCLQEWVAERVEAVFVPHQTWCPRSPKFEGSA